MPVFVHITSEDLAKKARRGGLRPGKSVRDLSGVYAMPVTPDFHITHQWIRELRQWKSVRMVGVYFKLPDSERVQVGNYRGPHDEMSAAEAAAHVMAQTDMSGVEVIIPRRIEPKDILRVRHLPQLIGWRHYPGAHGTRPRACECCQKGFYGSRRIRERYGNG